MKKAQKAFRTFIDEILDSEENQKKYGFTTEIVDGIRSIYYDGDISVLNEAMYGPSEEINPLHSDPERTITLSEVDNTLSARLPNTNEDIPVKIKIGTDDTETAYFAIVTETDQTLTQLCVTDPAYYPDESACRYAIGMRGLSALNKYVRNNFHKLIGSGIASTRPKH